MAPQVTYTAYECVESPQRPCLERKSIPGPQSDRRPQRTAPARYLQCLRLTLSPTLILKASSGIILPNLFPCLRSSGHWSKFPLGVLYTRQSEPALANIDITSNLPADVPFTEVRAESTLWRRRNKETVRPGLPGGQA